MAVATYKHGVTWRDVPTSIVAPITADSGIPVIVGAAAAHLASDPPSVHHPRVYYTFEEAVAEMGFSYDFRNYPLNEAMYVYFVLFNTGPIILINILDADNTKFHGVPVVDQSFTFTGDFIVLGADIPQRDLVVKSGDGMTTFEVDTDFVLSFDTNGNLVLTRMSAALGGTIPPGATSVLISYTPIDGSKVDRNDIIGGVDLNTGKNMGLEAIEDVFPALGIVPGIILTPGWGDDPEIAAVVAAKAGNINGCFRCTSYVDIDSTTVFKANDVYAWKRSNNFVDPRLIVHWPRVAIGDRGDWLSIQSAALTEWVDNANDNIPVESPSNKNLKMTKTIAGPVDTPVDVFFSKGLADMLNGQGIVTAINWTGGWKLWGNNTSVYPAASDPKDRWIPVRRMTDWLGNTLVLTCYQFVDRPGNRRLIDTIVDSINIYLNSLVSSGVSLGARVEFRQSENSDADLLNGHYTFHVFEAFPTPAEWIEFLLEFDVGYLRNLFNTNTLQTPITSGGVTTY